MANEPEDLEYVHLIVEDTTGPGGHGDPGIKYVALADLSENGVWAAQDKNIFAFDTAEAAAKAIKESGHGNLRVLRVKLIGGLQFMRRPAPTGQ